MLYLHFIGGSILAPWSSQSLALRSVRLYPLNLQSQIIGCTCKNSSILSSCSALSEKTIFLALFFACSWLGWLVELEATESTEPSRDGGGGERGSLDCDRLVGGESLAGWLHWSGWFDWTCWSSWSCCSSGGGDGLEGWCILSFPLPLPLESALDRLGGMVRRCWLNEEIPKKRRGICTVMSREC